MASIRKHNTYEKESYTYYPVLIIGAGVSGIALGCRLKEKLGFDQFRIFDRQAGIGGTWWINRYPGVACDVPAIFYSFSFAPNNRWTTFHPPGPEIVKYLGDVCEKYNIVDKIQLNTDVSEARWLEEEQLWEVTLTHMREGTGDLGEKDRQKHVQQHGPESVYLWKEVVRAKVLASAIGALVEPKAWPEDIPGRDSFQGDVFHSARWNHDVDLTNKDVVVVGTGCSAAQFVPKLTEPPYKAKSVTQLMRSPPWVVPRQKPPFGEEAWERSSPYWFSTVPGLARLVRFIIFLRAEYDWRLFGGEDYNHKERQKLEKDLIAHLKQTVPEKYHEILTPDYGVCCKRRIFDAAWLPSLNNPKIDLTTLPLKSIQPHGVTLGPGRTYPDPKDPNSSVPTGEEQRPADAIVLANGFDVGEWLHPLKIRGKGGRYLHDVWHERGGAQAYLGAAMDGFPNFFIIFGPNTATGHSSVILATENMVEMTLKMIRPILKGEASTIEVRHDVEMEYTRDIQEKLAKTVFMSGGCQSWYKEPNGWNSTTYPYSQLYFTYRCLRPTWSDWDIKWTTKGQTKRRARQALKYVMYVLGIVAVARGRKAGYHLRDIPNFLRVSTKMALMRILEAGTRLVEHV
ncbi:MAG: hypothetical protein M1833_007065 [Piccolia ochrophora]|nr:MAG: hypothetical protein M1833_007065 [Piccolia ochrophora]